MTAGYLLHVVPECFIFGLLLVIYVTQRVECKRLGVFSFVYEAGAFIKKFQVRLGLHERTYVYVHACQIF